MRRFLSGLLLGLVVATALSVKAKHYSSDYGDSASKALWNIAGSLQGIQAAQWKQAYWAEKQAKALRGLELHTERQVRAVQSVESQLQAIRQQRR